MSLSQIVAMVSKRMILGRNKVRWANILQPPITVDPSKTRSKPRCGTAAVVLGGSLWLVCGMIAPGFARAAEDAVPISSKEVQERWHSRMNGKHFVARIHMDADLGGLTEARKLTVHRDDEDGAAERVLIRFDAPESLRNLGFLYFEQADRPNDYFLYRPAVKRVRRLQQHAVTNNLYGVDPEFLGFGIAETEPTRVKSMRRVRLNGREVYRLVERARRANPRFEERVIWIDQDTFIPLRTEHQLNGRRVLTAETVEIRDIQGVPTPVHMRFERPLEGSRVDLTIEEVDYERPIPDEIFSVFTLMKAQRTRR